MSEREKASQHVSFGSFDNSSRAGEDDDSSERSSSRQYSKVIPKRSILNNSSRSSRLVRFKTANQHFEKVSFDSSSDEFDSLRSSLSTSTAAGAATVKKGRDFFQQEDDNDIIDLSSTTIEFAHPSMNSQTMKGSLRNYHYHTKDEEAIQEEGGGGEENTPLMNASKNKYRKELPLEENIPRMVQIACAFLSDYESGRACSLPTTDIDSLSSLQLGAHHFQNSTFWKWINHAAIIACFLSCSYIGFTQTSIFANTLEIFFISVFAIDLILTICIFRQNTQNNNPKDFHDHPTKTTTIASFTLWRTFLMIFLIALLMEQLYNTFFPTKSSQFHCSKPNVQCFSNVKLLTQALKPIIFFYTSKKCRDALEALRKVAPISTKVVMMELFTILSFATVACRLYSHFEDYVDLPTSFLSLFKLSTTVVNPSIWMPVYNESRKSAFFFILFIVTCLFYLHSLVLSVVYQVYIQAIADIRNRTHRDKEEALRFSFLALEKLSSKKKKANTGLVDIVYLEKVLQVLRPHYGPSKILFLVQIIDPENCGKVDFTQFRRNIPKALDTSLRRDRQHSIASDILTVLISVTNLIYVLSSSIILEHHPSLENDYTVVGLIITGFCIIDLIIRLNPYYRVSSCIRISRLLDGLAILAVILSSYGALRHMQSYPKAFNFVFVGRAIDLLRALRYFSTFNSIVQRTAESAPTLVGPLSLVFSWMHLSVFLGMALWRGEISPGTYDGKISPFYDLNNFNSYTSGLVTMFQTLVVNDWHAIASVFLFADAHSTPILVWIYFISANLIGVIIFNVMLAFFVGAFITKIDGDKVEVTKNDLNNPDSSVYLSSKQVHKLRHETRSENSTVNSLTSSCRFQMAERQGYNQILDILVGDEKENTELCRNICHVLRIFESISGVEKVGNLICCKLTGDRFGNHRFLSMSIKYMTEELLQAEITEMISVLSPDEVGGKSPKKKADFMIDRMYPNGPNNLRITASTFPHNPQIIMFICKELKNN